MSSTDEQEPCATVRTTPGFGETSSGGGRAGLLRSTWRLIAPSGRDRNATPRVFHVRFPRKNVQKLLDGLGDPRELDESLLEEDGWPDYVKAGLARGDAPQLIRIVRAWHVEFDEEDEPWEDPEFWSPVHAWRALGQLRVAEAVEPLLEMLDRAVHDDGAWALEELPEVFGLIGAPAIETLGRFLADPTRDASARCAVGSGLERIARRHPETRDDCVRRLSGMLEHGTDTDPDLNAFLICNLLDLKAKEAAEVIERAFADDRVEETICGDWFAVRADLGVEGLGLVTERRPRPRVRFDWDRSAPELPDYPRKARKANQKAKAKRKSQQKARKRNRRSQ